MQLATLLLKYLQNDLVHHRKELIKFGWNHLKREDTASKQWAFVNVCHFLEAYQAPEKIILQVWKLLTFIYMLSTQCLLHMWITSICYYLDGWDIFRMEIQFCLITCFISYCFFNVYPYFESVTKARIIYPPLNLVQTQACSTNSVISTLVVLVFGWFLAKFDSLWAMAILFLVSRQYFPQFFGLLLLKMLHISFMIIILFQWQALYIF